MVKLAVVDERGCLAYSDSHATDGDVLKTAAKLLKQFYQSCPRSYDGSLLCNIAHATVTGYGEELLRAALSVDSGVVETVAHARAAQHICPDVSFLLDIGGQDMKAIWIEGGQVVDAVLNEACSSGCGSFISGTAYGLHVSLPDFSEAALHARDPLDLGTKCTVFMSSRVKHAQKAGASLEDIAAGIAYSVVKNALYRVIDVDGVRAMGGKAVVQGGTFMSDAVLRAFELVSGMQVVRPDRANLMGAIGAALVARERSCNKLAACEAACGPGEGLPHEARSTLATQGDLKLLNPVRSAAVCPGCTNACTVSVVAFSNGSRFISGNRCERACSIFEALQPQGAKRRPPNAVALKQKLLARYRTTRGDARRGAWAVGVVNALHAYDQMPFWHTLFARLGFTVLVAQVSGSPSDLSRSGLETIPSESVCYPAKLAHVRVHALIGEGADILFMPRYERGWRCPVACDYALVLRKNVPHGGVGRAAWAIPRLHSRSPYALADSLDERVAVLDELNALLPAEVQVGSDELEDAVVAAAAEQRSVERQVSRGNDRALKWAHAPGGRGMVLLGRPYHADRAVLHAIDDEITRLGYSVISAEEYARGLGGAQGAWRSCGKRCVDSGGMPSGWGLPARTREVARAVAQDESLHLVCLQSFGCGLDAAALPDAKGIIRATGKPFTALKIDDMMDTAHIRIRLRTHAEACGRGTPPVDLKFQGEAFEPLPERLVDLAREGNIAAFSGLCQEDVNASRAYAQDLCFVAKALAGRAVRLATADGGLESLVVPEACQKCLLALLPAIVERACGRRLGVEWRRAWPVADDLPATAFSEVGDRPRVGIIGAAPLCFEPGLNDSIVRMVTEQGFEAVLPNPDLVLVDDVRYLDQLAAFAEQGIDKVIYLQSFGCLKGHVGGRGALRELERRFLGLAITVIDYDFEASALNRENRLRLALSAGRQ